MFFRPPALPNPTSSVSPSTTPQHPSRRASLARDSVLSTFANLIRRLTLVILFMSLPVPFSRTSCSRFAGHAPTMEYYFDSFWTFPTPIPVSSDLDAYYRVQPVQFGAGGYLDLLRLVPVGCVEVTEALPLVCVLHPSMSLETRFPSFELFLFSSVPVASAWAGSGQWGAQKMRGRIPVPYHPLLETATLGTFSRDLCWHSRSLMPCDQNIAFLIER